MAGTSKPPEPPSDNPILWVVRPLATAAKQFSKSLFRPSTIVYPFERLEDPKFRDKVAVAAGKPIGQLAREVAEAGQKAIGHASEILRGRTA